WSARTVRICYPAMNTTAIGTIPGGCLMFAGNAQVGIRHGSYKNLRALAHDTMKMFQKGFDDRELRLDVEYQKGLDEFHALKRDMSETNYLDRIKDVIGHPDLRSSASGAVLPARHVLRGDAGFCVEERLRRLALAELRLARRPDDGDHAVGRHVHAGDRGIVGRHAL